MVNISLGTCVKPFTVAETLMLRVAPVGSMAVRKAMSACGLLRRYVEVGRATAGLPPAFMESWNVEPDVVNSKLINLENK